MTKAYTKAEVIRLINKWKRRLQVDPRWQVKVVIEDSDEWDGKMATQSQRWEATLYLDEKLPRQDLERTIVHELLELQLWEVGDIIWHLVENLIVDSKMCQIIYDQVGHIRNRFIESLVPWITEQKE